MFRLSLAIFILTLPWMQTAARTQTPQNPLELPLAPTSLNVRDYGARGDGVADDTRAIQSAVNAATSQAKAWTMRVERWDGLTKGSVDNPRNEIVFPAGTYKITSPIVFDRFVSLRGVGKARIRQADATQDVFYFHGVQQADVVNLTFQGGRRQLHFWTNNIGIANLTVYHCNFVDSGSYAITCRSYTQRTQGLDNTKPWAPYRVEWTDGMPRLTRTNADDLQPWFNSTLTNIAHCRFENVMHAVDLSGDTALIRDCEVTTNPQMEGAAFRLGDLMNLYRIKGTLRLNPAKHQYWFETSPSNFYAGISLRDSEFTTDGAGVALIRSHLLPNGTSLIVENCRVKSAGSREGALLFIRKGTEPNIISINHVTEISNQPVKAVAWEETPDAATLEAIKDQPKAARTTDIYKIQIADNSQNVDNGTPSIFTPVLLEPIPATALEETEVPEVSWSYDDLERQALQSGNILFASKFGVDQEVSTDETANLQKLFDMAARQGNCLVVIPAGIHNLTDTIQLPPNIVVRAAGTASFVQTDPEKDLFHSAEAGDIAFKNCNFNGGRNGIDLHSDADRKARLSFENCAFYDQHESGIRALAGARQSGEANRTEVLVQGGLFGCMRGLTTNAALSGLVGFSPVNDPRLDNAAFIKNLGGRMRVQAMLSNPKLWQGKRSEGKMPDTVKNWQLSKNTRWIDNWGQLYSLDSRFGGECGGMCNVVNRSPEGTIYIGGGNARFYNGVTRKSLLYLEQLPKRAVVRNVTTPAARIEESWTVMQANGENGRDLPTVTVRGVPAP